MPDIMKKIREILSPRDVARVAGLVAREKVMPERTAENMGVGADFERTQEVLLNPSVDSVMSLVGRPGAGVFWPRTSVVGEAGQKAAESGMRREQLQNAAQILTSMAQNGLYNPIVNRVSFPRDLAPERERQAGIAVGAQAYMDKEGGLDGVRAERDEYWRGIRDANIADRRSGHTAELQGRVPLTRAAQFANRRLGPAQELARYQRSMHAAYQFLIDTARKRNVSERDIDMIATEQTPDAPRLVSVLLQEDMFRSHPLNSRRQSRRRAR